MVRDKTILLSLLGLSVLLSILLCFTIYRLVSTQQDLQDQLLINASQKEEIVELENLEQKVFAALKEELEAQDQRNANIEIEYMKMLDENKNDATPMETVFLNYLMKIYGME